MIDVALLRSTWAVSPAVIFLAALDAIANPLLPCSHCVHRHGSLPDSRVWLVFSEAKFDRSALAACSWADRSESC